jgi:hypothetical protein
LSLLIGIVVITGLLFKLRAHAPRPDSIARVGKSLPAILWPTNPVECGTFPRREWEPGP